MRHLETIYYQEGNNGGTGLVSGMGGAIVITGKTHTISGDTAVFKIPSGVTAGNSYISITATGGTAYSDNFLILS